MGVANELAGAGCAVGRAEPALQSIKGRGRSAWSIGRIKLVARCLAIPFMHLLWLQAPPAPKHTARMSSDSSAAAVFMNGGEVISCQNTPVVLVGGEEQLTEQRLWLFTPFTQLAPGSVAELASV